MASVSWPPVRYIARVSLSIALAKRVGVERAHIDSKSKPLVAILGGAKIRHEDSLRLLSCIGALSMSCATPHSNTPITPPRITPVIPQMPPFWIAVHS